MLNNTRGIFTLNKGVSLNIEFALENVKKLYNREHKRKQRLANFQRKQEVAEEMIRQSENKPDRYTKNRNLQRRLNKKRQTHNKKEERRNAQEDAKWQKQASKRKWEDVVGENNNNEPPKKRRRRK